MSNVYYLRPSLITINSDEWNNGADFVLSDAGRAPVEITMQRIGYSQRMANGRMRTKWIADKQNVQLTWNLLASRQAGVPDNFASATDLKDFYDSVQGSFTVTMYADDGYGSAIDATGDFVTFAAFLTDFSYSIEKRGKAFDLWNVSMTLEEA